MLDKPTSETLADLRAEIDRVDARLHELLMERGETIDRLIAAKAGAGGSAFRPDREAQMMRRLVARHGGILPLDTVETIWRIIISTFTYVQAPYNVHCDVSAGDAAMRDCCRFHFGFTVPFVSHPGTAGVIAAVAASAGDLGLLKVEGGPAAGAWWCQLAEPSAPKIIARLPFVERSNHPVSLPLFVVAKPLTEGAARDIVLYAASAGQWRPELGENLSAKGIDVLAAVAVSDGFSLLLAAPGSTPVTELADLCQKAGILTTGFVEIGSHAARFEIGEGKLPPPEDAEP